MHKQTTESWVGPGNEAENWNCIRHTTCMTYDIIRRFKYIVKDFLRLAPNKTHNWLVL